MTACHQLLSTQSKNRSLVALLAWKLESDAPAFDAGATSGQSELSPPETIQLFLGRYSPIRRGLRQSTLETVHGRFIVLPALRVDLECGNAAVCKQCQRQN